MVLARLRGWFRADGTRPRLAALATAITALTLAIVASGRGCAEDQAPEEAARTLIAAARAGDADAVYALLGPATRARLGERAARAQAKAGGRRTFDPRELLEVKEEARTSAPVEVALRERRGDHAMVEVTDGSGRRDLVALVRESGTWRVELPDPSPSP